MRLVWGKQRLSEVRGPSPLGANFPPGTRGFSFTATTTHVLKQKTGQMLDQKKDKNTAGRTPECVGRWTGATLLTPGRGQGSQSHVDVALQVVPGRLQEQSQQMALREGGALP